MRSFYWELLIINVASLELESFRAKDNPLAKIDLDFSFLVFWLFKMFKTSKTFLVFKYFCFRGYHLKQRLFEIIFWKNLFFYISIINFQLEKERLQQILFVQDQSLTLAISISISILTIWAFRYVKNILGLKSLFEKSSI